MIQILQQRSHLLTIYKVNAHSNIFENEKADALAKIGNTHDHTYHFFPHEYAYTAPYFLHKDIWLDNMSCTP